MSGEFDRVRSYKLECPRFTSEDFKNWLLKLEQFFELEKVYETAKIWTVMLSLEDRALQWHHYFIKTQGGIDNLSWVRYLTTMRDRFAPAEYEDHMVELVSLRQTGMVEQFHKEFLSYPIS